MHTVRCTPIRCPPIRLTLVIHAREMPVREMPARETPACGVHAYKMHAREMHAYEMDVHETHAMGFADSFGVRRWVFCNRKPGLRLDTARWEEDAELLVLLFRKKTMSIYARSSCLPPCHLGPAQLDLSAISV